MSYMLLMMLTSFPLVGWQINRSIEYKETA